MQVVSFLDVASEAERRAGRSELEICILQEQKPTQSFFSMGQREWGPNLGQPQRIALSELSRRLYVTSILQVLLTSTLFLTPSSAIAPFVVSAAWPTGVSE